MHSPAGLRSARMLSLSLLSLAVAGCSGYVEYADTRQSAAVELTPPFHHHPHEPHHPSLFSLLLDWLADHGGLGQLLANVLIAILVLPPIGPVACGLLHNCDTYRLRGRSLLLSALGEPPPPNDTLRYSDARSSRSLELFNILEQLDAAYDKYA